MAGGYGAGLFDSSGPKGFASAVKGIADELTHVTGAFTGFGTQAAQTLGNVSSAVQDLINKLGQVSSQLQTGMQTPGGVPGGQGPAAPTGGGGSGGVGAAGDKPGWYPTRGSLDGGTGAGDPSMDPGTAAKKNPPTQGQPMQKGSASGSGLTMGQRAAYSIAPAALGSIFGAANNMLSTAVQGVTIGDIYGSAFGTSSRSLYQQPKDTLSQNPADYAQANYYGITQLGIGPGTRNFGSYNQSLNQMMREQPGLSRQQAAQDYGQTLGSAQFLNVGMQFGMNFSPGGKVATSQQMQSQLFDRLTQGVGGKPTAQQIMDWTRPGGPWSVNLQSMGIDPGSDAYTQFVTYALTRAKTASQGKAMPNLGTKDAKSTPLGNNPYNSQLQTQSALSRDQQEAEPMLAQAAKTLNDAAGALLRAVNPLAALFGGNLGGGGLIGMGGQLAGGLAMGGLMMGGSRMLSRTLPRMGRWAGRVTGAIGGALSGRGGTLGKIGGVLLGRGKKGGSGGTGIAGEAEEAAETMAGGRGGFGTKDLYDCICGGGLGGGMGLPKMTGEDGLLNKTKGKLGDLFKKMGGKGGAASEAEQLALDLEGTGGKGGGTGLRSILNKLIGGDVAKDAETLGMESHGFGGLFSKAWGGVKGFGGKVGGVAKEGGLLSKAGGLVKGKAGGLLARVGLMGGEAAGLEGAGAALDATGIGAPIGLALNVAGLGLMFHKQIGQAIGGIGHALGGLFKGKGGLLGGAGLGMLAGGPLGAALGGVIGSGGLGKAIGGIGGAIGGLFGHHHKKTTATAGQGGSEPSDDVSTLLQAKPDKDSVLALFTQKPPTGTLAEALSKKTQGAPAAKNLRGTIDPSLLGQALAAGGGGAAALAVLSGGTASAQTGGKGNGGTGTSGSPYAWNYRTGGQGPIDLAGLFVQTGSKSGSSGSGGTGTSGSSSTTGGAGSKSAAPTGSVAAWIAKAMQLTSVSGDDWTNGLNLIIQHESGGNPKAINLTDSNAVAGHPSQGLMQLIPATFQSYAVQGFNSDITDPVSNIAAGIKYIQSRYHGIDNVPGVKNVASGKSYVGYARGTQLVDRTQLALLHRGEAVVPASENYSAAGRYNRGIDSNGSGAAIHLNFKPGSIVLQVPPSSSQQDMDRMANQFVAALSKPAILAGVRGK